MKFARREFLGVAAGAAVTLSDPDQRADDGREIAIRY